jgi:hypothetical protein
MDVLELLDALELEISALRAERDRLTSAFELAQKQLRALLDESRSDRAAESSERKKRTAGSRRSRGAPTESGAPDGPAPAGKRRALGRTLAEIRGDQKRASPLLDLSASHQKVAAP